MMRRLPLLTIDPEAISDELVQTFEEISNMSPLQLWEQVKAFIVEKLPALGMALLLFCIGYVLIKVLLRFFGRVLGRSKADEALHSFILSTIKIILYVILAITCVGTLGVNFTPMIAALSVLGLAVSLAVQDILSNIAGGISVLFSRPFSKGDYVEIGAQPGTIMEIGMVYTMLKTTDNKIIYLPNGDVAKATVVNYSSQPVRRMDLTFYIKAASDYDRVRDIIFEEITRNPLALSDPPPIVRITDQSYAHITMSVMVWADGNDLYEMKSQLIGAIRSRLVRENLG